MTELRGYIDAEGKRPFAIWLDRLDAAAAAKVTIALSRMEGGNFSNVKGVGEGVFENRIDFGPGYRVYFGKDGELLVILLAGGPKKRQNRDIVLAQTRWADYKGRKKQETLSMALTHDFKETILARARRDASFRQALLREAIECIVNGEIDTGRAVLRDYVNATVGFLSLEKRTGIPAKSLMRMLGPKGSPSVANLSSILTALKKNEKVSFQVALKRAS